jgi:hypothetical protein
MGGGTMVEGKEPRTKRGRKKGSTTDKETTTDSVMKVFQKEYDKLIEEKKKIEKKMRVFEKSSKELGFKLSKRVGKTETETGGNTGKKRGRKKKEVVLTEGKSE